MKSSNLFSFDPILFVTMIVLIVIGILFIYSSGITSSGDLVTYEYISQIIWAVTGLIVFFVIMTIDYNRLKIWVFQIYLLMNVILIVTLFFGKEVNGAKSWIGLFGFGVQPSEFMKLSTILYIAYYLDQNKKHIETLTVFIKGILIVLIPTGLILLQPDLGTASIFLPIYFVMAYNAGVKKRYISFFVCTAFLAILFGILPVWQVYFLKYDANIITIFTDKNIFRIISVLLFFMVLISLSGYVFSKQFYFYWLTFFLSILFFSFLGSQIIRIVLKDYQIMRLIVFIDPSVDPQGSGWNIIQSVTAVGSGGFWGKGFLEGTQSHYRFLPQQSTDFIFSIIAEELGFIGTLFLLFTFTIIILRGLMIAVNSKDSFGAYVVIGIVAMYFFHMIVNIGMTIGVMPITGIPLFFLSYGGSSLWTGIIGMAFIQNIYLRRYRY
jgi:rod shape determining protein RodA